jgi:riboflavin kinase/FMN adenylyltransferase
MKLLRGFQEINALNAGSVATIGNFDGVHLGHQSLLRALREEADRRRLPMIVVVFEPQPCEYFQGLNAPPRLSRLREKLQMLQQYGIDYVYCLKFDEQLSNMEPNEFAERIFSLLHIQYLLVGADFHFGRDRKGDFNLLQKLGQQSACKVDTYPDFSLDNQRISSTNVRQALQHGQLAVVEKMLGRPYNMCGRVMYGAALGRKWRVPTANLSVQRALLAIKGIFCVQVRIAERICNGVANIGNRPTLDGSKNVLEVHLFDFNESIYGEMLNVDFLHKLRDEIKFQSMDALIMQIHADVAAAKAYFKNLPSNSNDRI